MRAVNEAGLRIPDDILVVGFDDAPWTRLLSPPLSVVVAADARDRSRGGSAAGDAIWRPGRPPPRAGAVPPRARVLRPELIRLRVQLTVRQLTQAAAAPRLSPGPVPGSTRACSAVEPSTRAVGPRAAGCDLGVLGLCVQPDRVPAHRQRRQRTVHRHAAEHAPESHRLLVRVWRHDRLRNRNGAPGHGCGAGGPSRVGACRRTDRRGHLSLSPVQRRSRHHADGFRVRSGPDRHHGVGPRLGFKGTGTRHGTLFPLTNYFTQSINAAADPGGVGYVDGTVDDDTVTFFEHTIGDPRDAAWSRACESRAMSRSRALLGPTSQAPRVASQPRDQPPVRRRGQRSDG